MKEFDVIYDEYFEDIYKFILSLSKNPAVAEDIVQDTFIKALQNIPSLNDPAKIKSWLFQIAKNTYLTHVSKSAKTISVDEIEAVSTNDEVAEFLNKDTAKQIHKLLHKQKEPRKEVFYLKVFAGLSFKEIAEIFDKKETWARQVYHRVIITIRRNYNE